MDDLSTVLGAISHPARRKILARLSDGDTVYGTSTTSGYKIDQGVSITDRYEYRMAAIPGWMRGQPTSDPSMSFWIRFKDRRAPDPLSLFAFVDAAYPAVMEIGEGAYLAAGSVITQPVPADALAIGRSRQANKEGWARKRRKAGQG